MAIIMGITSPLSSDISACLLKDGEILDYIEEERLSGIKHDGGVWPLNSINKLLKDNNLCLENIDYFAIGGGSNILKSNQKINQWELSRLYGVYPFLKNIPEKKIIFVEHHLAHIYSVIGFLDKNVDVLSLDGFGDNFSGILGVWDSKRLGLDISYKIPINQSLGEIYESLTKAVGYTSHRDEGIVMALAQSKYDDVKRLGFIKEYSKLPGFKYDFKLKDKLFKENSVSWKDKNKYNHAAAKFSAKIQKDLEFGVIGILEELNKISNNKILVFSGGVALNCLLNKHILENSKYFDLIVPPWPNDAGLSIGAAIFAAISLNIKITQKWPISPFISKYKPNLKSDYSIIKSNVCYNESNFENLKFLAELVSEGNIISTHLGNMEAGPRALGNRSIIAESTIDLKNKINIIKKREPWRPLAPIVYPNSKTYNTFNILSPSSYYYMNNVAEIANIDETYEGINFYNTARIQLAKKEIYPDVNYLLFNYFSLTGNISLINTSFNVSSPIVYTIKDAYSTFLKTNIDYLYIKGLGVLKK